MHDCMKLLISARMPRQQKKSSYSGSKSYCRASVAEDRIKVAEMETIAAEKKATNATTMVATLEERTRKAEEDVAN